MIGGDDYACHLLHSIYGLKQSPRTWSDTLGSKLSEMGFTASLADPALWVRQEEDGTRSYTLVYVDDLLMAAPTRAAIDGIISGLRTSFEAKDMGEPKFFLGMTVERDRDNKTIALGKRRHVADLLEQYGMTEAAPLKTPLPTSIKLRAAGQPLDTAKYPYLALVGSLLYLAGGTRPDITQPVGALTRYGAAPTAAHWDAAKHVLRYLRGTQDYKLHLGGSSELVLTGYCDADFAGCPDTRRSTTAYIFTLNGGAVSWCSRMQKTIAASTTESEYVAQSEAAREALWLRKLLMDLGATVGTIEIKTDSQSALKLLNPIISQRSKHIDVCHHFTRERIANGELSYSYLATSDMPADALAKSLAESALAKHRLAMGLLRV